MKYLIYILLITINSNFIFSYLKIPFKTFDSNKLSRINKLQNNYIYINISLGFPNQYQTKILIKQEKYHFHIYINSSYLYSKSQTYSAITKESFDITNSLCKKGLYVNDIMYLNEIKYENTPFILCTQYYEVDSSYFDGQLGLNMGYEDKYDSNFIRILKSKNIINNYIYSLIYENDEEGILLIGEYPHNINLKNDLYIKYSSFEEENLNWMHAVKNEKNPRWSLTFDKIYYSNSELFQIQRNCILSIENKFIISTFQYFNLVRDIFGKKCKNYQVDYNFQYLSCDKDIDKEFTPEINFFNKELNITFTFDYNDLFVDDGDSLNFLVATYADTDEGYWILGKPFFKKYLLLYNMDSKMVGFYKNKTPKITDNIETNGKKTFSFNTSIFINILLFIIIIILSFALYHCYINKRRIRANELEDKFNYIAKKDDNEIKEIYKN